MKRIPLYLLHMPNPLFPRRMIMRGFGQAQERDIISAAGVSNHSLPQWQAAEAALGHPVAANQVLLNLLHRGPLDDLVPWAALHRRLIITASPLGQGMLTGPTTRSIRPLACRGHDGSRCAIPPSRPPRRTSAASPRCWSSYARSRPATTPPPPPSRWPGSSATTVVAIPGASTISQLEANAAAADIILTAGEQQALTAAASQVLPAPRRAASGVRP